MLTVFVYSREEREADDIVVVPLDALDEHCTLALNVNASSPIEALAILEIGLQYFGRVVGKVNLCDL